ncbi:MAG: class I SAM-dependent methyltransferase [Fimbriimonadaceae bacterium]|nr:class I SAM-dependent methyltransferase [Alphaproteobacteria bacterium]
MSRLDMFIDRMEAQRRCLNHAVDMIRDVPGPVFELGLGNGRTYDHLRELFPDRDIFVFERKVACHPSCIPPDSHLFLGEVTDTLEEVRPRFRNQVALLHTDLGGHSEEKNIAFAQKLSPLLEPLMAEGGIIVGSDQLYVESWQTLELPDGVKPKWGHVYKA